MLFNEKRLSCVDSPFGWHHSSVYLRMAWPYRILKDIPQSISCMLLNFWWIWIWRPWLRAWAKPLKSSRPSCQGLMLCWGCNTILVVFFRKIYRAKKLRVYKSKRLGVSSICKDRLKLFLLFVEARKELFAFKMYSLPRFGSEWWKTVMLLRCYWGNLQGFSWNGRFDGLAGWVVMGSDLIPPWN